MRDLAVAVLVVWGTDWPHTNSDYGRGKPLTEISPGAVREKSDIVSPKMPRGPSRTVRPLLGLHLPLF
jgi:hypothetical protein